MANNARVWSVSKGRIFCIFLIGLFCAAIVRGQTTIPSLNESTYNEVLDRLFPRGAVSNEPELVFVVRYEPSFAAESQITIVQDTGRWRLFRQQSESGNVYIRLGRIMEETGREDLDWLVRQVTVRNQEVILPQREIEELQRQLINSLGQQLRLETVPGKTTKGRVDIVTDQTRYRIWYRGAMKVEIATWGTDTDKPNLRLESAIVRWAKRLSLQVSAAQG